MQTSLTILVRVMLGILLSGMVAANAMAAAMPSVHASPAQATIAGTSGLMALADEAQTLAQAREHRSCKKLVEPPQTKPKKCSGSQPAARQQVRLRDDDMVDAPVLSGAQAVLHPLTRVDAALARGPPPTLSTRSRRAAFWRQLHRAPRMRN
ncbi:MAG: hypothetical protein AAGF32_05565 [Pseudomonadota bacterium]